VKGRDAKNSALLLMLTQRWTLVLIVRKRSLRLCWSAIQVPADLERLVIRSKLPKITLWQARCWTGPRWSALSMGVLNWAQAKAGCC